MTNRRYLPALGFGLLALLAGAVLVGSLFLPVTVQSRAALQDNPEAADAARLAPTQAGNYCVGCHLESDPYLQASGPWQTTLAAAQHGACPAALRIQEELYYTERLFLMIDRAQAGLPGGIDLGKAPARLATGREGFARLLDTSTHSLLAFNSEAQMLRYDLNKVYTQIMGMDTGLKRQRILLGSLGVTAVVLLSLAWGFRNTQTAASAGGKPRFGTRSLIFAGVALLLIFGFFALPIFRSTAQTVASATTEELERQATLDEAQRAADAAERAQARAAMLGKIGAAWFAYDPVQGEAVLDEALKAADEANVDAAALWGEAQKAREAAAGSEIELEKAANIAAALSVVRDRAWAYRQIAEAWLPVDPARAETILETALEQTYGGQGLFHDLDVRALAVAWADIDPGRAVALLEQVQDPALRAWGWRELAVKTADPAQFQKAVASAEKIADPLSRALSLSKIIRDSEDPSPVPAALQAIEELTLESRAYALAELASAAKDPDVAAQIEAAYPGAQALAYRDLGDYGKALQSADRIDDPFTRNRILASIAVAARDADIAQTITDPLWRDKTLWEITQISGKLSLAENLQMPYYQVQALTAQEKYPEAWQLAEELGEPYPLSELALRWAPSDTQAALEVIDALEREADKAAPLRAVALANPDDYQAFERALGMALAARVRNDALAPAQASLDLALAFAEAGFMEQAQVAFEQALSAAERIAIQ